MKKICYTLFAAALLLTTQSCKNDFENDVTSIAVTSGQADFSKYIALGNSLTSGYRDNALYVDGQNESYPSMIAQQMKLAGGGDFKQPLMSDNLGGLLLGGTQIAATKLVLSGFDAAGSPILVNATGKPTTEITQKITGTINNMGIPGAKVAHLIAPGYGSAAGVSAGTANPYYARFATSNISTVLGDALAQSPTFVSLWIGNNDVLGNATAGGDDTTAPITPAAGAVGIGFEATYEYIINQLFPANTTRKGIVANIPYVTTIPFFTTVPYKPVPGNKIAANIASLTQLYTILKSALTYLGAADRITELPSATAANAVLIQDETLADLSAQLTAVFTANGVPAAQAAAMGQIYGKARQSRATDLILLSTASQIGSTVSTAPAGLNLNGLTYPFADKYVLIPSEITALKTATDAYNAKIQAMATAKGLAFVDANAKMTEISSTSGLQYDGVKYGAKFITGGTFSLDGVHLTGRGYAMIANEFIKAINRKYGSNLPQVNPNGYSGVTFP